MPEPSHASADAPSDAAPPEELLRGPLLAAASCGGSTLGSSMSSAEHDTMRGKSAVTPKTNLQPRQKQVGEVWDTVTRKTNRQPHQEASGRGIGRGRTPQMSCRSTGGQRTTGEH
eukprot:365903-Chlamydomonas_euryale.AAC.5